MLVFSDDAVNEIERRYGTRLKHRRPDLYKIATSSHRQATRLQIEEWVSELPSDRQKNVIENLRKERTFWETYNELWVGDWLTNRGHAIEYEPSVLTEANDLTPDWYVTPSSTVPSFYVEVYSPNPAREHVKNDKK